MRDKTSRNTSANGVGHGEFHVLKSSFLGGTSLRRGGGRSDVREKSRSGKVHPGTGHQVAFAGHYSCDAHNVCSRPDGPGLSRFILSNPNRIDRSACRKYRPRLGLLHTSSAAASRTPAGRSSSGNLLRYTGPQRTPSASESETGFGKFSFSVHSDYQFRAEGVALADDQVTLIRQSVVSWRSTVTRTPVSVPSIHRSENGPSPPQ
jgi:hypothetical protein